MSKVLVLGSSYIAKSVVSYLSGCQAFDVTVASDQPQQAEEIASRYHRTSAVEVSIQNEDKLSKLIAGHDLVVSLLPSRIHPPVAKLCIAERTNLLTASYLSAEVKALGQQALDAGITIFNEIGLDPGIDHMLAMQCFDEVRSKGGKIRSYVSWCTGLPAPEVTNVPLKYKFSWSPLAVLTNTLNPAKCLREGKLVSIPSGELMRHVEDVSGILDGVEFEGVLNRDSTKYIDIYDIPEVHTLLRGSLRYKGFCATMSGLQQIGLISSEQRSGLQPGSPPITWQQLLANLIECDDTSTLRSDLLDRINGDTRSLQEIEDMGLLSANEVPQMGSPVECLTDQLLRLLSYKPGERDMCIIHDTIGIEWPDNSQERRTITVVDYGDPEGFSAMARMVGIPAGIAAKMLLEGKIKRKGNILPITKDIYLPILDEMKAHFKPPTVVSNIMK